MILFARIGLLSSRAVVCRGWDQCIYAGGDFEVSIGNFFEFLLERDTRSGNIEVSIGNTKVSIFSVRTLRVPLQQKL